MKKATVILALVVLFNATAWAQQANFWGGLLLGLSQGMARQQQAQFEREKEIRKEVYRVVLQYATSAPPDVAQQLYSALSEDADNPQKLDKFSAKITGIISQHRREQERQALESQREREAALALQRQFPDDEAIVNEIRGMLAPLSPEGRDQAREGLRRALESGKLDNVALDDAATKRAIIALTLLEYQPAPQPTSAQFDLERELALQRIQSDIIIREAEIAVRLRSLTTDAFQEIPQPQPVGIPQGTLFTSPPALLPTSGFTGTSTTLPNRFGTTTLLNLGGMSGSSVAVPNLFGSTTLHRWGNLSGTSTTIPNRFGSTTFHNFGFGLSGTSTRIPSRTGATTFHTFQDSPGSRPVNCKSEELWGTVYTTCR